MSRLILDLEVAARAVVRARVVSVLAVIAFALGIGIATAVFSIFNGVLLAPLPFPQPDRLVMLLVAVVASYFPARSAGRVDPMVVLRDA